MDYIRLGKIVNTHGIKGEIRIISDFKFKDRVFKKGIPIYIGKLKTKEIINSYRHHKQFDMITLLSINNINEVLKYKGESVYIDREDIALGKGEYLDEDLIGLNVIIDNKIVGNVIGIRKRPPQDLLVVKVDEKDCLIPYVSDIILDVDLEKGQIIIEDIKVLI